MVPIRPNPATGGGPIRSDPSDTGRRLNRGSAPSLESALHSYRAQATGPDANSGPSTAALHLSRTRRPCPTAPPWSSATPAPAAHHPLASAYRRPGQARWSQVGDRVLKGQLIGEAQGYVERADPCLQLRDRDRHRGTPGPPSLGPDGPLHRDRDRRRGRLGRAAAACRLPQTWTRRLLRERIRWAGVVGLGGAAFPTSVKLTPAPGIRIQTLIINGAECEPYITCDDRLMRERPERILQGARIMRHLLGAERVPDRHRGQQTRGHRGPAPALAETAIAAGIEIVAIPTLYPSGGEKQLIRILTGQEVPSRGIPAQIGIVCQNVGTAAAVADAVLRRQAPDLAHRHRDRARRGPAAQPGGAHRHARRDLIAQCGGLSPRAAAAALRRPHDGLRAATTWTCPSPRRPTACWP